MDRENYYIEIQNEETKSVDFTFAEDIILVYAGEEMKVQIDNIKATMDRHDIAFIRPNAVYKIDANGSTYDLVHLSPLYAKEFIEEYQNTAFLMPIISRKYNEAIMNATLLNPRKYIIMAITNFFAAECIANGISENAMREANTIRYVVNYINNEFDKNPNIDDLASQLGYATHYVSSRFTKEMGGNFLEFVNRKRIEKAKLLLEDSTLTVLDIATKCGYNGVRSLNRNFVNIVNMTPSEYRESLNK